MQSQKREPLFASPPINYPLAIPVSSACRGAAPRSPPAGQPTPTKSAASPPATSKCTFPPTLRIPAPPPNTISSPRAPTPSILQFVPVALMSHLNQPQHAHEQFLDLVLRCQVLSQKFQQLEIRKPPVRNPSRQLLAQPLRRDRPCRSNLLKRHPVQRILKQRTIQQVAKLHPRRRSYQIRAKQPQSLPLLPQLLILIHFLQSMWHSHRRPNPAPFAGRFLFTLSFEGAVLFLFFSALSSSSALNFPLLLYPPLYTIMFY